MDMWPSRCKGTQSLSSFPLMHAVLVHKHPLTDRCRGARNGSGAPLDLFVKSTQSKSSAKPFKIEEFSNEADIHSCSRHRPMYLYMPAWRTASLAAPLGRATTAPVLITGRITGRGGSKEASARGQSRPLFEFLVLINRSARSGSSTAGIVLGLGAARCKQCMHSARFSEGMDCRNSRQRHHRCRWHLRSRAAPYESLDFRWP